MRLETISTALAQKFQAASHVQEARREFESIFHACVGQVDEQVFFHLGDADMVRGLKAGSFPDGFDFARHIAQLDGKYFDAEDEGRDEEASACFTLARLFSALSFAHTATDSDSYAEAAYESIMSLPEPQAFTFDI